MPFNIGPGELIILLIIALVLLGPARLPDVAQSLGKSLREFRKAAGDISDAAKVDVSTEPTTSQMAPPTPTPPPVLGVPVPPVTPEAQTAGPPPSTPVPLPANLPLVVTSIGDPFAIRIRIALVAGVILAMPVWLWHVWRFVAPGLTASERRAILPWIPAALAFFLLGVGVAYVVLPFAAAFLLSFLTPALEPLLSIREYFDFVTTLFLAFGILMEFPILLVGLSRVGIVTSARLRRSRRVIVLGIALFSAGGPPGGGPPRPPLP